MTHYLNRVMLLAVLIVLGHGGDAHAEAGIVVVGGNADEHARATATVAIENTARQAGWSLATKRLTPKETDVLLRCKDGTAKCVPASLGAAGINQVLAVIVDSATADDGSPMFVLVGRVIVTSPQASGFNKRHCEHCADDRLQQESTVLVQEMLRQLASQSGRTVVDIKSTPPGAQIVLDGNRIGVTDAKFSTFPGKHVVVLEKPGYAAETHEFTVEEGKTAAVSITLRPSEVRTPETPTPRASRLFPGLIIGGGAAVIVGGVILFALDDDQSPTGEKEYLDSAPAGIAVGIAGLAAVGVGTYLWMKASRSRSTPSAAVTRDGAVIGWGGSF